MNTQTFHLIKMRFTSPLHLSVGKPDYAESQDFPGSGMLKNAIFVSLRALFGEELEEDAQNEAAYAVFRVSSGFPFLGERLFFPRPASGVDLDLQKETREVVKRKKLKKVRWLEKEVYEKVLQGETIQIHDEQLAQGNQFLLHPKDGKEKKIEGSILSRDLVQRVAVPQPWEREGRPDAEPFHLGLLRPNPEGGLFFLLTLDEEKARLAFPNTSGPTDSPENSFTLTFLQRLKAAVRLLQDEGLGTARSRGLGQFTATWEKLELKVPANPTHHNSLSAFCPETDENGHCELNEGHFRKAAWKLTERGGWVTDPVNGFFKQRKKWVYMMQEGAVLAGEAPRGHYVNLAPDHAPHPVWRDGRAIWIPMRHPSKAGSGA